jgi:hypothetical protein
LIISLRNAVIASIVAEVVSLRFLPLRPEVSRLRLLLAFRDVTIEDGGVVETASKTIPILLQTVDLTMYPEGGDLVAGLPCQVYFEAFTPAGKPADLSGILIDEAGNRVTSFRSEHEGRGRFGLTPKAGREYRMKITEPAGITTLVRHDQLKELVKAGTVDAYEVLGRDVVLYWRSLAAEQRVDVSLSLVAAIPGQYTGPASRAYLYYTDEHKTWNDGLKLNVVPKTRP